MNLICTKHVAVARPLAKDDDEGPPPPTPPAGGKKKSGGPPGKNGMNIMSTLTSKVNVHKSNSC